MTLWVPSVSERLYMLLGFYSVLSPAWWNLVRVIIIMDLMMKIVMDLIVQIIIDNLNEFMQGFYMMTIVLWIMSFKIFPGTAASACVKLWLNSFQRKKGWLSPPSALFTSPLQCIVVIIWICAISIHQVLPQPSLCPFCPDLPLCLPPLEENTPLWSVKLSIERID